MRRTALKNMVRRIVRRIPLTTLQWMYVMLGCAMLVVCIVFFSVFSYVYRRSIRDIVADEMKSNLERINSYIDLMVRNSSNISSVLASNQFLQLYIRGDEALASTEEFRDFYTLFVSIANSTEFTSSMDLYIQPHRMMMMSDFGATTRLDDGVADFLDRVTASEEPFWAATDYRRHLGTVFVRSMDNIAILRPLYSFNTGEKSGFLAMNVEPASFQQILRTMQGSECIILDGELRPVVDSPAGSGVFSMIENDRFRPSLPEGESVVFQKVDGREYVFVTADIETIGWRLVSFTPTDVLVHKGRMLQTYLMGLILILVSFLTAAVVLVMRQVGGRIQSLVELMDRVKGGDFRVDFRAQGADEFSYLFESFNSMVQNVDTLFNEIYRLELMHKDVQLKLLQNQMNPHFIYNIFNNMSWLIQLRRYGELEVLVDAVAVFFSRSLNDGKSLISIRGSVEKLESYVQIQQIRFRDRFVCEIHVDEELMELSILNHIIQPLLENAFVHGVEPLAGMHRIEVEGKYDGQDAVVFTVRDDGAGIPAERLVKIRESLETEGAQGEFFALQNVHRRIKMFYGEDWGLTIESVEGQGTTATVRIPRAGV